jgi:peptide deformylase
LSNYQIATAPDQFRLRIDPDPLLYTKLEPFDFNCGMDTEQIEQSMIVIMEAGMGMGIAANQVGFNQRVIVLKPKAQLPFALFNPEIISGSEEVIDEEGCLSFPNLFIKISRFKNITVKYLDKLAKDCTITLSGYDAKCVQHEIDHLDGITFTKRVSKLKLDLALKKQRKLDGRTK